MILNLIIFLVFWSKYYLYNPFEIFTILCIAICFSLTIICLAYDHLSININIKQKDDIQSNKLDI